MGFDEDCHSTLCSIDETLEHINKTLTAIANNTEQQNVIFTKVCNALEAIAKNTEQQNQIFTKICGNVSDISTSFKAKIELDKKIHNLVPSTD